MSTMKDVSPPDNIDDFRGLSDPNVCVRCGWWGCSPGCGPVTDLETCGHCGERVFQCKRTTPDFY